MKNACLSTRANLTAQAAQQVLVFQWDNFCRAGAPIENAFWGGEGGTNPDCLFASPEFCKRLSEHRGSVFVTTDGEIGSDSVDRFGKHMGALQHGTLIAMIMTPPGRGVNASVVAPFFAHPNALVVSTTGDQFADQKSPGNLKVLFSSGIFGEFVASSSTSSSITIRQIFERTPEYVFILPTLFLQKLFLHNLTLHPQPHNNRYEFRAPLPKDSLVLGTETVIVDALFRSGASLTLGDLEWLVAHFGTLELTARTSGRIPQFRQFLLDVEHNLRNVGQRCDDERIVALQEECTSLMANILVASNDRSSSSSSSDLALWRSDLHVKRGRLEAAKSEWHASCAARFGRYIFAVQVCVTIALAKRT
jgi:hypothetical protein